MFPCVHAGVHGSGKHLGQHSAATSGPMDPSPEAGVYTEWIGEYILLKITVSRLSTLGLQRHRYGKVFADIIRYSLPRGARAGTFQECEHFVYHAVAESSQTVPVVRIQSEFQLASGGRRVHVLR